MKHTKPQKSPEDTAYLYCKNKNNFKKHFEIIEVNRQYLLDKNNYCVA